ncbi:hypothetical protein VULLAG_LOCUS16857 [Vulpes lagopus]
MAQPGGPEATREDAAGDGFADVIKSRAGRISLFCSAVWGCPAHPAALRRGRALEVSTGFPKVAALSPGAAEDRPRAPARVGWWWGGGGRCSPRSRKCCLPPAPSGRWCAIWGSRLSSEGEPPDAGFMIAPSLVLKCKGMSRPNFSIVLAFEDRGRDRGRGRVSGAGLGGRWPSGELRNPRSFTCLHSWAKGKCQRGDRKARVPGADLKELTTRAAAGTQSPRCSQGLPPRGAFPLHPHV